MINFRKIVSVLTSAAMLGSTIALATAASYPQPFVKNGMADAAVVYGSGAAGTDFLAALDIHKQLTSELLKQAIVTPSSAGSTVSTSGGDSISLAKSSQKLYVNSSINAGYSALTNVELPNLLASGSASDSAGTTYAYTQKITPGARQVLFGKSGESMDPIPLLDAGTSGTNPLLSYTLSFSKAINITDTTNVVGTATVKILGKDFTIGANSDAANLYLYGSGTATNVDEGETKTITVASKEHTVSLKGTTSTTAATVIVNGVSKSVTKGASYKFADGFEIYIKDLYHATKTGTLSSASLLVGSQTIHFLNNSQVRLGSSDEVILQGTSSLLSTSGTTLSTLTVNQSYSDATGDYIKAGDVFTDRVFGGAFKMQFASLSPSLNDTSRGTVVVDTDNSVGARIKLVTKVASGAGKTDAATLYYGRDSDATSNTAIPNFRLADSNNYTIHVAEGANVSIYDYVLVNSGDKGRILQLQSIASTSSGNDIKISFKDALTGETIAVTTTNSNGTTTNVIDSQSYSVYTEGINGKGVNITWGAGSAPGAIGTQRTLFPRIQLANGGWFTILSAFNVTNATTFSVPGVDSLSDYESGTSFVPGNGLSQYNVTVGKVTYETANLSVGNTLTSVLVGTTRCNFNNFNSTYVGAANNVTWPSAAVGGPAILIQEPKTATGSAATNGEVICIPLSTEGTSTISPSVGTPVFSDGTSLTTGNLQSVNTKSQAVTTFGTLVESDTANSNTAALWLPSSQTEANILVTAPTTTVSGVSSSGSTGAVSVSSVMSVSDTEVTTVATKNLIVVGGSCINTVAAKLLGSATPLCGADFTTKSGAGAGSYVLQSFESPYTAGKVATLVAGYNAADTTNGVKFLTTQTTIDTTKNKKYLNGVAAETAAVLTTTTPPATPAK